MFRSCYRVYYYGKEGKSELGEVLYMLRTDNINSMYYSDEHKGVVAKVSESEQYLLTSEAFNFQQALAELRGLNKGE